MYWKLNDKKEIFWRLEVTRRHEGSIISSPSKLPPRKAMPQKRPAISNGNNMGYVVCTVAAIKVTRRSQKKTMMLQ